MCIIGGCSDNAKIKFQKTMTRLKDNLMEEEEDWLDLPNGLVIVKLLKSMTLFEMRGMWKKMKKR
jgi:hypothetical protein